MVVWWGCFGGMGWSKEARDYFGGVVVVMRLLKLRVVMVWCAFCSDEVVEI